ncbi:MAG: LruC domain-containing protein [Paludibacter sp.]
MKTMSSKTALVFMSILSLILTSCMDDKFNDINSKLNFANFDFKTTKQVKVNVTTLNLANQPLGGVFVELYSKNPLNSDGILIANSTDFLIYKGMTNSEGKLNCEIAPATTVDSLNVIVNHIGLPAYQQFKIASNELNITIGGTTSQSVAKKVNVSKTSGAVVLPDPKKVGSYYVLGSWNNSGYPAYLWATNDVISNELLNDINASLPERVKLPVSHPEYLTSSDEGNIVLIEDAEVWVTFVHEGAGYLNTLGYYTHPNDKAPALAKDITDATIIFPNVSYAGSGGSLVSGNKVQLLYLDPVTQKYSNRFPAGTTVAWFFKANAFSGSNISAGYGTYYSDKRFNPEVNITKRKHNVILKDDLRKLLLIGFEDINCENGSDEDFNDGVFYSTVTPYTAVKSNNYKPIDTPKDADGDGVTDSRDEYPNDKDKAFNNYYPGKNQVGTLAFEDLWPNKGDYDFNDLVIDYNYNQITNAQNLIVEIDAALTVKAIGASLRNPFAISFNTAPDNIKSVTGQQLNKNIFDLNTNGTEKKQAKAVIPVFDDPFIVLGFTGSIVNTVVGGAYAAPKTIDLKIVLNNPVSVSNFGTAPYNPFIIVGGERSREVHLPGSAPTDLVDASLFGTGDDNTDLKSQKYYMSDKYLPWAINLPIQFAYPAEKQDITKTYLMFNNWANSRGYNYMDWYQDIKGYRDTSKLFIKK